MWNYNLDEMPKDGTKIVGFFKHDDYVSTSVFYYDSDDWRKESHCLPVSTRYLQCWTYAPKKPTELLVDWFDHVYPKVSNESGVKYQDGLEAIKKRIEFKLAEHGGKQPVMAVSDEKVAEKCRMACNMYLYEDAEAVCLECGKWREKMVVSDEKEAESPGLFPKAKPRPCFTCSIPYEGNGIAACTACGKWREKMADSEKDSEFESPGFQVTNRGFWYFKFNDYNGHKCSLQKSSLADEYCVWLGREKNEEPHHVTGHEMSPRMHLTQSQAKWLGEKLIKFAKTGELSDG